MTVALEILEWAKDKSDLSEIHYENRSGSSPIDIKITFDSNKPSALINGQRLTYVSSPAIGQLSLNSSKTQSGQLLKAGDIVGEVYNGTGPVPISIAVSGKIIHVPALNGQSIGYGEPVLILETTEALRP